MKSMAGYLREVLANVTDDEARMLWALVTGHKENEADYDGPEEALAEGLETRLTAAVCAFTEACEKKS
jgi:hypothetical protein